jgi:hypothetical protein
MSNPVCFSYSAWVLSFPELSSVSQVMAEGYFAYAEIIQRNDGTGPVSSDKTQLMLLNLLTAHICVLNTQTYGDAQPGAPKPAGGAMVGRVNSATEGSVTVSSDYGASVPFNAAWFLQTRYGAMWWQMTGPYRTMRYTPGRLQTGSLFSFTQI